MSMEPAGTDRVSYRLVLEFAEGGTWVGRARDWKGVLVDIDWFYGPAKGSPELTRAYVIRECASPHAGLNASVCISA